MLINKIVKNLRFGKLNKFSLNISKLVHSTPKMILRLFYNFDPWHISSFKHRSYAKFIVEYSNKKENRNSALEIGCGLGDITLKLDYKKRMGLDNDINVIRAAIFLEKYFSRIKTETYFKYHDFTGSKSIEGKYDLILIPNFVHAFDSKIVKGKFEDLYKNNLNIGGEILVDIIKDKELKNYINHHSIEYLTKSMEVEINSIGDFKQSRRIYSLTKKK